MALYLFFVKCTPMCTLLKNMRTPIDWYAYSIKNKGENNYIPLHR